MRSNNSKTQNKKRVHGFVHPFDIDIPGVSLAPGMIYTVLSNLIFICLCSFSVKEVTVTFS